jgi:hypothetical protein
MPSSPAIETVSDLLQAFDPHGELHGKAEVREVATGGNCAAFRSLLRYAKKHFGGPLTRERFKALIARVSNAHRMSYVRVLRLSLADFHDRLLVSARDAANLRLTQVGKPAVSDQKRLTEDHQKAFDLICEHGPLTGKEVVNRLGLNSESLFTSHYVPELKRHGIENRRGLGYYHPDHYKPGPAPRGKR